jgi:predicted nucleotidyltransferase
MRMTSQEILDVLKADKPYLRKKFGLLSVGLFGSYVKGVQVPSSDIDLLVEFAEPSFDSLAGLQIYLERRFGRPIELIRKRKGLSERFIRRIEKDIRYA